MKHIADKILKVNKHSSRNINLLKLIYLAPLSFIYIMIIYSKNGIKEWWEEIVDATKKVLKHDRGEKIL